MEAEDRPDELIPDYDTILNATLDSYQELLVDHLKLQKAVESAIIAWKKGEPIERPMARLQELLLPVGYLGEERK